MTKETIKAWVKSFRENDSVKVFVHNKVSDSDLNKLFLRTPYQAKDKYKDNMAHIVAMTDDAVAYRIRNNIYYIPAKVKAVPFGLFLDVDTTRCVMEFDYPCEMKVEDLEEF